jgi:aspartokinase/homoserine dehydrogenase 1
MRRIIQLTSELFSDKSTFEKTIETLKKRDGEETFLVFPSDHLDLLFAGLATLPFTFEAKSYEEGEGKLKAAKWAVEIGAEIIEQWTTVKGVYTADPRKVSNAQIIPAMNYREAQELASAGTGLLDRKALNVLMKSEIELHIRSIHHMHELVGTTINAKGSKAGVKAISSEEDVALVALTGVAFWGIAGVDAQAFSALAEAGISVKLVSQASSERSLGLVVAKENAEKARKALSAVFVDEECEIQVTEGLTILNVVGRHNYALERAIYELRRNNIWLHLIANSVEGHQISMVIDGKSEKKALDLVHSQLLGALKRLNVFCFGKGLVGGTFIRQVLESAPYVKEKRKLDIRIIGVADTQGAILFPEGIPANWREELASNATSNSPEFIADWLKESGLSNLVVVDNTADTTLTDSYPIFVKAGCDLVASNKKANAREQEYYDALRILLDRRGKTFKYETNVGAGLPLVDTLIQLHHSSDRITRIKGVFSGSMSFLFNTFSESERAFSAVLNEAQLSGYTEPDPREDLNGMDVARKLLILARTVDVRAELSDVSIQNLIPEALQSEVPYSEFKLNFPALDAHYAAVKGALPKGHVLRFIGDLSIDAGGKATLKVELVQVPKASPLGGIKGSDSLFEIYTDGYGDHPMVIQGAGAGAEVTARGVYSDVLRLG